MPSRSATGCRSAAWRDSGFHPMYYPDEKILLTAQNGPMWEEIAAADAIIQFHLRAEQADQIGAIARRHPHLTLILDHLGYPQVDADSAAFQPIVDLARYDNVHLKLSDVAGHSRQDYPTPMCIPSSSACSQPSAPSA